VFVVLIQTLMPVVRNKDYHFEYTNPGHGKGGETFRARIWIMAARDTEVFMLCL